MKKIWKWILGILVVLIVIAALVGLAFVFRNRMMSTNFGPGYGFQQQQGQNGNQPNMPGWNNRGGDGYGFRGPMMGGGRGFDRFGGGHMFFGGFFQLIVFGLLLYGAYWLGRRNARITMDPKLVAEAPKKE